MISENPGGGVFIAILNSILATHQPQLDSEAEVTWVKTEFVKQKSLYIASFYRKPGHQEEPIEELEKISDLVTIQWIISTCNPYR